MWITYLGSRTYEGVDVFVSFQAETRNDAIKYVFINWKELTSYISIYVQYFNINS